MRLRPVGLAACLLGLAATTLRAQQDEPSLKVGDDAPALAVSKWVQGDPVEKFEDGKVYVVEFWATWCGPCKVSIPHLTELQEKYKDKGLTIIGVDAYEPDPSEVEPFVNEMGDKMAYNVALDDVPEDGEPQDGKMAKAWMDAAGQGGIPTAFIVDQKGKVAYIGHPMQMDVVLEKVITGEFDPVAEQKAAEEKQQKLAALLTKLQLSEGDPDTIKKVFPEIIELMGDNEQAKAQLSLMKFTLLMGAKDDAGAAEAGEALLSGPVGDNPDLLNNVAWMIVDPERPEKAGAKLLDLARKAAEKAVEASKGENWMILDTLARVRFLDGDAKAALELQEKAVKLGGEEAEAQDDVKARLEEYREAAGTDKDAD